LTLKGTAGEAQRSLSFAKRQLPLIFSITTRRLLFMQIENDDGTRRAVNDDDAVRRAQGNPVRRRHSDVATVRADAAASPNRSNQNLAPYLRKIVAVGLTAVRTYSREVMVEDRTVELDGSVRGRRRS